ncbi:MAG: GNAT family N-acetyltransferase [Cyclobacteriaceae bacterium]|nr:GNAT family N-acetyltransferase [Cyclobacteriaceae bacterium]MCK5369386.1 GNAT family N-acetyltransferase [Cyclobacteriaceae bacterium]
MKNHEKTIHLSIDTLSMYGFACFHYKEEPLLENNFWLREIVLSAGEENKPQQIKIPKKLLVEISHEDKIVNSKNYKIDSNSAAVKPIKLLSERAGWNQTLADLDIINAHAENGYRLATYSHENQEIPLGSGLSLPVSDDMSWIGMILVHPELRRQGIARSIMNSCLEYARLIQNKSIVGLDATPQGKQVYDSLGFKDSYKIWRSDISTDFENDPVSMANPEPLELERIRKYLNRINNTERYQIVELLESLPGTKNIMVVSGGTVCGFVMSRPGRIKPFIGPLIADSNNIAISLLNHVLKHWKSMGHAHAFIDVPEYHIGERSIFTNEDDQSNSPKKSQFSINPLRSFVRMYQLISESELEENLQKSLPRRQAGMSEETNIALKKAIDSYEKTLTYMEKEKRDIIPSMYAIGGPEMS